MSQHSLLNIQEISSRTFHNEQSMLQTSIEPIELQNHPSLANMARGSNRIGVAGNEQRIRELERENQRYKLTLRTYINRIQQMEHGNVSSSLYQKEVLVRYGQLEGKYQQAIDGLRQTVQKNQLLQKEVQRLRKKLQESELNYSRDHAVFQKSQNMLSNLSITKSNYQIQMVNMKDSLVILQKQKQGLVETNEEYEEKLVLLSQQIERLRGLMEHYKRENQKFNINSKEQQEIIRKIEADNAEIKSVIERLQNENRDLKSNRSSLSLQLQQYHQKIVYKETLLNDLQERENKITQALKAKDSRIRELEARTDNLEKSSKVIEEESNVKNSQYMQELGRTRIALNEALDRAKRMEVEKEQILREYNELTVRFDVVKKQLEVIKEHKQSMIKDIQKLSGDNQSLAKERGYLLKEREQIVQVNQELKQGLEDYEYNFKQLTQDRSRQNDATIKHFQEKEKGIVREYQAKLQLLNQQRTKEIAAKINELNQYKIDMSSLVNELNTCKMQLATKNSQITQLKQSTMSQSTIIDTTRRDFEQKLKEKKDENSQQRVKIQNLEKLLEQNRRQKDIIFQEKNNEIKKYHQSIESIAKQTKKIEKESEVKTQNIENYKRALNDKENIVRELNGKLNEADSRIMELSLELERMTELSKEKDTTIAEIRAQYKQICSVLEERNREVGNLRQVYQKMRMNVSKAESSKENFLMFQKQIERLNEVIGKKDKQLQHQKVELAKIIQKIDLIYQQQMNIIRVIENTYADDVKREGEVNSQLTELRDYIGQLNEATSYTLNDIYHQGGDIVDILKKNEADTNLWKQEQIAGHQRLLYQKDQQIKALRQQLKNYEQEMIMIKQTNSQMHRQLQQRLVELDRQNSALKSQLDLNKSEFEAELQQKSNEITDLAKKCKQVENIHKKEINQLKEEINQREKSRIQSNQLSKRDQEGVNRRQSQLERTCIQKDQIIEVLKASNSELSTKMQTLTKSMNAKLGEIEELKLLIKANQDQRERSQFQQLDKSRLMTQEKEIQKLQKIIQIRNIQISNNEESYFKLKRKFEDAEKQIAKAKVIIRQLKTNQHHSMQLQHQIRQLSEERNQQDGQFKEVMDLKGKNLQLERELNALQNKLRESEHRLALSNQQIDKLKVQLQKLLEFNSKSISRIESIEHFGAERETLYQKIADLEDQLQRVTTTFRQIQIEYNYLRSNQHKSQINLQAYEHKNLELQKQYLKLKEVLANLSNQNSRLQTKNYYFEVELKKADVLQQKIQVLNGEINRLSFENINLNEEVTSCKLALGGESINERKAEEQLGLLTILFAQIESLRSRLKDSEQQLHNSRSSNLLRYRK